MSEEDAQAPTIPAPAAVLVEGTVARDESSLVPPPVSGERQAVVGFTLPYVKKNG